MNSLSTKLKNRTIRYDGVIIARPEDISALIMNGVPTCNIRYTEEDEDIIAFNKMVGAEDILKKDADEPVNISLDWNIPQELLELDLDEYILNIYDLRLKVFSKTYTNEQLSESAERLAFELNQISIRGMTNFIKTVIFIIDEFRKENVVWGVGRGSSCASYVLFLLGLHVVDPIIFDIAADEFFHD